MQLKIQAPSILVCVNPVDFRRSIDGLVDVILGTLNHDPKESIFIFHNRMRNKVKLLAWHKNGFILLLKRLERGRFSIVLTQDDLVTLEPEQLSWLLAGLDWVAMSNWGELEYVDYH